MSGTPRMKRKTVDSLLAYFRGVEIEGIYGPSRAQALCISKHVETFATFAEGDHENLPDPLTYFWEKSDVVENKLLALHRTGWALEADSSTVQPQAGVGGV